MKVSVIIELQSNALDNLWSYTVDHKLQSKIKLGQRVKIPFGRQIILGFIVKIENIYDYDEKLLDIIDIVDEESFVNKRSLNLVKYLESNFFNRKVDYLNLFVLKFIVARKKVVFYPQNILNLTNIEREQYDKFGYLLTEPKNTLFTKDFILISKKYRNDRYIKRNTSIRNFELFFEKHKKNKQLANIHDLISDGSEILVLSKFLTKHNLQKLLDNKIVKLSEKISFFDINLEFKNEKKLVNHLSFEQQEVVSKISIKKYQQYLLQGVTGSGKTHVFIDLIKQVNAQQKIAYVLIPEIGLSYKIFEKLSLYIEKAYLYHYKIPDNYKLNLYKNLQKNDVNLIVGTRSSLFLNNENIGLIIFDEEHDEDFYSNNTPTFDAKVLAKIIAKSDDFPIVYSSATPSLSLKKLEDEKEIIRLDLKQSYNKFKNTYEIVKHSITNSFFSKTLLTKINSTYAKNEQTILLFNKKAYAQYLVCNNCNHVEQCNQCFTTLKVYVSNNKLKCLNCGLQKTIPNTCSSCNQNNLNYKGYGIEQVYNELIQIYEPSQVILVDGDILNVDTKRKEIMHQIENNEVKIILGTQIIAKGFDFKNITLGAIIDASNSLNYPNVNAREVTFQLLNQFMGRIGRHKQGHIILQTLEVENELWKQICESKYDEFATQELKIRQQIRAVPYVNECYFKLANPKIEILYEQTKSFAAEFTNKGFQVSDVYVPWVGRKGLDYLLEFKVTYTNPNTFRNHVLKLKQKYNKYKITIGNNPPSWR